jgi:hypothetical protein
MTMKLHCDQCDGTVNETYGEETRGWIKVEHRARRDDDGLPWLHFCSWPCVASFAMSYVFEHAE